MTFPDRNRRLFLAAASGALVLPAAGRATQPTVRAQPRVVCLGDSILATANVGGDPLGKGVQSSARGEANLAQAFDPRFRLDTWPDAHRIEGQQPPYFWGANQGRGGEPSAGALARLPKILDLAPDVLVVASGTNDLQDPARVVANLDALCAEARRARPSLSVVLATVRPVVQNTGPAGPRPLDRIRAANAGIRDIARRREGVILWDAYAALAQQDGWGLASDFEDGLHLSPAGALKSGALAPSSLAKALDQIVPPGDVFAALFARNLMAAAAAAGTAPPPEGVAGGLLPGMTAAKPPGGAALTCKVVAGPSGPVQTIRVQAAPGASGAKAFSFRPSTAVLAAPGSAGRWVRLAAKVSFDAWPGWLCPFAILADRSDPAVKSVGLGGGQDHWIAGAKSFWVATPPIVLSAASEGVLVSLSFPYHADTPGSGVVQIDRWAVAVVGDPRRD